MDTVIGRLQSMTADQLRESMLGAGLKCGPITSTTRTTYERKLAQALMEKDDRPVSCDTGEEEAYDQSLKLNQSVEETEGERSRALCKQGEEKPTGSTVVYYGVCPQREEDPLAKDAENVYVFVGRQTALKVMGKMPGARFKAFSTREEAETFSKGMNTPKSGTPSKSLEKANEFPNARIQDLTCKLRIAVEQGDQKAFMQLVWDNPRFLIGHGDNPTIVHIGCHYNCLHVAAKENQPGIAKVLLDTLENPAFLRYMYPHDQETVLQKRMSYIVDLYLNTPDKTYNDTPLHFACKFGSAEVVNVLCSHSTTDKQRRNKYGEMPCDVVCERKNKYSSVIRKKIEEYLEDRCYLHLLRATDNSVQPVFRFPCSPSQLKEDPHPLDNESEGSPIDPILALRAYVGPLSPSKAEAFHKLWKNSHRNTVENPANDFHTILKTDPDRGMECVGREMAHKMGHPWAEYWDFLDSFVDLSTEEGLNRLEDYLEEKDRSVAHQNTREVNLLIGKKHLSSSTTGNDSVSPVCNLLQQFEKADLLDGSNSHDNQGKADHAEGQLANGVHGSEKEGLDLASVGFWTAWGRRSQAKQKKEDDLSSTSSEEYLTADEDSVDESREDESDRKNSVSSYSSCQSIEDTSEYTPLKPQPSTSRTLFIEGGFPTKLDNEVLSAIENVKINSERYPFITKWRNIVRAYPSTHRLSWPSPVKDLMKKKDFTSQRITSPWHPRSLCSPSGPGSPN